MVDGRDVPIGYDSEFTNKNATIMSWNLMHTPKMLRDNDGFPAGGNVAATWREYSNAADQDPEQLQKTRGDDCGIPSTQVWVPLS